MEQKTVTIYGTSTVEGNVGREIVFPMYDNGKRYCLKGTVVGVDPLKIVVRSERENS